MCRRKFQFQFTPIFEFYRLVNELDGVIWAVSSRPATKKRNVTKVPAPCEQQASNWFVCRSASDVHEPRVATARPS